MASNETQKVVFQSPRSIGERTNIAESCVRNLHIEIPALLDNFQNTTEGAYTGWPDRLYVIGKDGRVAFKSAAGPFGFAPAKMEVALKKAVE
jgi:type I thyroxine 5'-deiodinase